MARWQYNFNSGILASGKTRMPPKNLLIKAKSSPESPWENWSLPTTSQLHDPVGWWLSHICDSYTAAFCCRDVGPNGPNNKHNLEEHLWHVTCTTSTVASSRVARLEWLPSQAKLPLHDGWRRTPKLCPCS